MSFLRRAIAVGLLLLLSGCGALTGLPGHGGGKRFAVEQELVAAATRATIKKIDFTSIRGRKVNLFVNAIGDTGSGNLVGGRYSVISQLRGDYIQVPPVIERSTFPRNTTTTTSSTTSSSSASSSETTQGSSASNNNNNSSGSSTTKGHSITDSLLSSPDYKRSEQKGTGAEVQLGVEYKGLGAYMNSDEISSNDLQYLSGLFQTYLYLQGVNVVPPSEAELDVYITVDVFGTVRTRVEWFIANNEILRAKTALEVMAIDHLSGELVMLPQSASIEAEYNEQYILWAGPIIITKFLKPSEPLLVDFTGLEVNENLPEFPEQDLNLPYPFRHQIEKWLEEEE